MGKTTSNRNTKHKSTKIRKATAGHPRRRARAPLPPSPGQPREYGRRVAEIALSQRVVRKQSAERRSKAKRMVRAGRGNES